MEAVLKSERRVYPSGQMPAIQVFTNIQSAHKELINREVAKAFEKNRKAMEKKLNPSKEKASALFHLAAGFGQMALGGVLAVTAFANPSPEKFISAGGLITRGAMDTVKGFEKMRGILTEPSPLSKNPLNGKGIGR